LPYFLKIFFLALILFVCFQNCGTKMKSIQEMSFTPNDPLQNTLQIPRIDTRAPATYIQSGNFQLINPKFVELERLETTGIMFKADYASACRKSSVKADLYFIDDNGTTTFQNRCYANAMDSTSFPGIGFCYLQKSMASGINGQRFFIRLWKLTSDCQYYADEVDQVSNGFEDFFLSGQTSHSNSYRALSENRLVTLNRNNYVLKMDRNGGATYEFYNKRAQINGNPFVTNSIHSHQGAALQVAVHDHESKAKLMYDSCDQSQGYWNPTQAGFYCSFKGSESFKSNGPAPGAESGLNITCDGTINNNCDYATSKVIFSKHKMYNWDYGPSYPGPYNPKDAAFFSQDVSANENYVSFDITFENRYTQFNGPIEIPTYYFTNRFRTYYIQTNSGIQKTEIPEHRTEKPYYRTADNNVEINWISFENSSGTQNDNYTIAWFYSPEFKEDIVQGGYGVHESAAFGSIKFTNQPIFNIKTNKIYRFKYVIFPYKYSDVIQTQFGQLSVLNVIEKLRAEYLKTPLVVTPTPVVVTPTPVVVTPTPTPKLVSCQATTKTFSSTPNSNGITQNCTAQLPTSNSSANAISATTVSNNGQYSIVCQSNGSWANTPTVASCPAPEVVTPTPIVSLVFDEAISKSQFWPASNAIDNNPATTFSSQKSPTSIPSADISLQANYESNKPRTVSSLLILARMYNGIALGFPKRYKVFVKKSDNVSWELVAEVDWQPNTDGAVLVPFTARQTTGVLIVPLELGIDNEGSYYFQLNEIKFQ
jgi:hypothetical protein